MKTRIDGLESASPQLTDTGGTVTDADVSALLAAKGKADKEEIAQLEAKFTADQKRDAERLKNDPDLALKRYASLRASAEIMDEPFRRMQHLSQEQSEALTEAEFQRKMRIDDMLAAQKLNESGVDAKTITKQANDEFASSAKAALGDDLYEQFSIYERQKAAWAYVNTYGGNVSVADMPLSMEQATQLADAIANACPSFQKGKDVDMRTVDWNAVDAAVVDFLTPEQMNFFKNSDNFMGTEMGRRAQEFFKALPKLTQ